MLPRYSIEKLGRSEHLVIENFKLKRKSGRSTGKEYWYCVDNCDYSAITNERILQSTSGSHSHPNHMEIIMKESSKENMKRKAVINPRAKLKDIYDSEMESITLGEAPAFVGNAVTGN